MKKVLSVLLAIACAISLAACGQKNDTSATVSGADTQDSGNSSIADVQGSSGQVEGQKGTVTVVEYSELQVKPEFNGLYKITGHFFASSGNLASFQLAVESLEGQNEGMIDLSNAKWPDNIVDYLNYLYISLTFNNNQIVDWDFVDIKTQETVTFFTSEEVAQRYSPETTFEVVEAGDLPSDINLSDYEVGKTYVFNVTADSFNTPNITNDTDYPLLVVAIKTKADGDFSRMYYPKHVASSKVATHTGAKAYYMAVLEGDVTDLINSDECVRLQGYDVGDKIRFSFEDYIANDTDKAVVLSVKDGSETKSYTLLPGEVLSCSWLNSVWVDNIS